MKGKVQKISPVDEKTTAKAVKKVFMATPAKDLHNYYPNCGLTRAEDPYKDLNV